MNFQGSANTLLRSIGRPPFMYGTAWKKETTTGLVQEALNAGFTAIDTACQPRHYREDLVGDGIRAILAQGKLKRDDIFLQTKFTAPGGQDVKNMPYDPQAPLSEQIQKSIKTSLHNLRPDTDAASSERTYIDCLVLHSPLDTDESTLDAWQQLETYVPQQIRSLGISNTDLPTLKSLYNNAKIKPVVVQNRFYPEIGYDVALRAFCREHNIIYESFWTLTANPKLIKSKPVLDVSKLAGVSPQVALYSLVIGLEGIAVLNGTTKPERMKEDLRDLDRVKNWTFVYRSTWEEALSGFKLLIGET